ncbi:MAG: hypothetical protein WCA20_13670, partial [Candidatus Sulfotelmatobacter sp.]
MWQAAAELAREHGVYSVAHPLRLDYTGLKKRLGGVSRRRRKARKPAFFELIAPPSAMLRECVIEFESLRGVKVGDLFMSLIHTRQMCGANSFDYLTELQRHAQKLATSPAEWMPWNYRVTLERMVS